MYKFHAFVEYINTFSNESSVSAGYNSETSKNNSKKSIKAKKKELLILMSQMLASNQIKKGPLFYSGPFHVQLIKL